MVASFGRGGTWPAVCAWLALGALACGGESGGPNEPPPGGGPGTPERVTATGPIPDHLWVENNRLYWTDGGESAVSSVPLAGGSPTVVARRVNTPSGLVVKGGDLYWIEERSGFSPSGSCISPAGGTRVLHRSSMDGSSWTILGVEDGCGEGSTDLVVTGTDVYWVTSTVTPNIWSLRRTPVTGGASAVVASSSTFPIVALKEHQGFLYWMIRDVTDTNSSIHRMPLAGGAPTTIAHGFYSRTGSIAVNSTSLFFTQTRYPPGAEFLVQVPLAGGTVTDVGQLAQPPVRLVASDTTVWLLDNAAVSAVLASGGTPSPLAPVTDQPQDLIRHPSGVLIWSERSGPTPGEKGTVKSVSEGGGQVSVIGTGGSIERLFLDGADLFWTEGGPMGLNQGNGRIVRSSGGAVVDTVVSGIAADTARLVVTATHAYIADLATIERVPLSGGVTETVAEASNRIVSLATDGAFVYWVDQVLAQVYKAPVTGGAPVLLATPTPGHYGPGGEIRVMNGTVYWMADPKTILAVPAAGGAISGSWTSPGLLSDFVVDGTAIWLGVWSSGVWRQDLAGGAPVLFASGGWWSRPMIADGGTDLYWVDELLVYHNPKAGDNLPDEIATRIAPDQNLSPSIAVSSQHVFWTEWPIREIWRLKR